MGIGTYLPHSNDSSSDGKNNDNNHHSLKKYVYMTVYVSNIVSFVGSSKYNTSCMGDPSRLSHGQEKMKQQELIDDLVRASMAVVLGGHKPSTVG